MAKLAQMQCLPCKGKVPPLTQEECSEYLTDLSGWEIAGGRLRKSFEFPDFVTALAWVNRVGELAESAGHHPDIHLAWGRVTVEIWTHRISALSINDFILAARIDSLDSGHPTAD